MVLDVPLTVPFRIALLHVGLPRGYGVTVAAKA